MLQRQENLGDGKRFSVRASKHLTDALETFAYENRMTTAAMVTHLLSKALNAERGEAYQPENAKGVTV